MNGKEFKESLKSPKHIYCLVTIDSGLVDIYVKRFKEAIGADNVNYSGTIKTGVGLLKKVTLNVIYMPKLDEEIFKQQRGYTLIYTESVDKRTAVYKNNKDCFIELENDYVPYVMKHSDMDEVKARNFVRKSNNDLGTIINNLKIYNLSDGEYKIADTSNDIYLWVDRFVMGKSLPNIEESAISIMAVLSTNCQDLLKIKQGKTAGMNPYRISNLQGLLKYRSEAELISIINDCFYLDCSVKKGIIDIDNIIDYLIMKYRKKV